jgi:ABC-2 type transport system permease protein
MLFLILYLVFTVFLPVGKGVPHYPQYLLLGIVLWNYFAEVTTGSVGAIVGKGDLMRKINFPKYVIVVAGSFSALINLLLNGIVISIFMYFGHIALSWHALLLIPLIAELFVLAISIAFLLSALFVRFRDISYIWEVIMQAAFYATPILYALQRVPHRYAKFLILNPMAQIIQDARHALIGPYALTVGDVYGGDKFIWLIPLGTTFVLAIAGGLYFRGRSKYFAEEV